MARFALAFVAAVLATAACVSSNSIVCPETGLLCPADATCGVRSTGEERCVRPAQVAACVGLEEGGDCDYDGLPGACREGVCEAFFCGDGFITNGEACDGANLGEATCADFGYYGPETPTCRANCTFELATACGSGGRCGDSTINGPELCDGPTTKSCLSIGFDAGTVRCDQLCGFTIIDCTKFGWSPEALDMTALGVGASTPLEQWAVGVGGKIMQFDGAFWGPVESGVTNDLKAVWAQAPYAWTVGLPGDNGSGVVLFWNGLAATPAWQPIASAPAATYNDVWAIDPMAVYVATQELGVQRYDGTSWSAVGTLTSPVYELAGTSPTDLWAATEPGLQHWDGSSWTLAPLPDTRIRFVDANTPDDVWVAGERKTAVGSGVIAHWDGTTWRTWVKPQEIYNGITSTAPNDAWLVVASGELRHWDGEGWSSAATIGARPDGSSGVSGFHAIDANHVVGVSTLRLAFRYRGITFGQVEPIRLFSTQNPYNSDPNTDVWSASANELYVTNVKGQVLRYDGTGWTVRYKIPGATDIGAGAIWGASGDALFVGASDGTVHHWNGATWTVHLLAGQVRVDDIWGTSPTDVWAFSSAGAFHWDGAAWTRHLLSSGYIHDASGGGGVVYAVENAPPLNKLWRFANGTWSTVDTGTTTALTAVVVVDPSAVHVAAQGGHLLQYDGQTWRDHVVPAVAELHELAASGPRDVIAASARELFSFDGVQWSPMRTPVDFVPNTPDYFPITALAVSPTRVDILLEKWRVRTLLRTRPFVCETKETCGDGIDNDCDGDLDSADDMCP